MTFSGHSARKRFGQHWLVDQSVLEKIILAADLNDDDRVLEVGPGRGVLTERLLASKASSVHAIELDRDLVTGLKERFKGESRFSLTEGDVLKVDLTAPDGIPNTKVVANIPYNITGPLLERLLGRIDKPLVNPYKKLVILLQKEVADRILAQPGQSAYSGLSVRFQLLANSQRVCAVPPNAFRPPPKVQSQVIVLDPLPSKKRLANDVARNLEVLLRTTFLARRKMLKNTLRGLDAFEEILDVASRTGINLNKRPQDLSIEAWLKLAQGINNPSRTNSSQ